MPRTNEIDLDYRPSYLAAGITALAVFVLYLLTLAPSTAMWDTSEYMASAYVLGNPHPPGNPMFVLLGRVFAILPLPGSVAVRINTLAAVTSALAAGFWFLVTERVLVSWLADRWQRIVGGVLAAVIGATAFTVWNQSVVNEKVYTVSLFGLAAISWLTVRWSDDPDGRAADRILVLIAFLLGLGYANHMMGFLAGPAVVLAVLIRRPRTIFRAKMWLACFGALALGVSVFAIQPVRAAYFPGINEGEPTACRTAFEWGCTFSQGTWDAFWYNLSRGQYGKPSPLIRQAPYSGQIGMYWLYFKWQWFRDAAGSLSWLQNLLAAFYMVLGLLGGWVHFKRDRRSFWYLGTFMFTLTVLLIYYLNFKYGHSQCADPSLAGAPCEVRDRDYFFIVSFSAWGVWAALGFIYLWESLAEAIGSEQVRIGKETVTLPRRRSWLVASPVLVIALVPLFLNWTDASRAGQTFTRDFAHDMLNSVEPYGVLVTVGDNDTFPLWFAQEVEGFRKDVVIANTSLLGTDWYVRQLLRRPVYEYDEANGPEIYRNQDWPKPSGPPLDMTMTQADQVPLLVSLPTAQVFRQETPKGTLSATIPAGYLERDQQFVLRMIRDSWPQRPFYFSRTSGTYGESLGLGDHLLVQGFARKLLVEVPRESADTLLLPRDGWTDLTRTRTLWDSTFLGAKALLRQGKWVDNASSGIPLLYVTTAIALAQAEAQLGHEQQSQQFVEKAQDLAHAAGLR